MKKIITLFLLFAITSIQFFSLSFGYPKNIHESKSISTSFNLLMICPAKYQTLSQTLIDHKNELSITATLKTTEYIFENYPGRDNQEKIKYCIKEAYDTSNISFVLLLGGFKDIPVRYIHNNDEFEFFKDYKDLYFISDLYYADLYDKHGMFQTWDTNEDGIYGEWNGSSAQDYNLSLTPEVALGRLPCSNRFQVKIMINKIIDYETSPKDDTWFNRFVVAGGDTYSEAVDSKYVGPKYNLYEGEKITAEAVEIMSEFEAIKLWGSTETLSEISLLREITTGCGFLYLSGHGNAGSWVTYPPNRNEEIGRLTNLLIPFLRNRNKLPITISGGCLNSQFDVHPSRIFQNPYYYSTWRYKCWSWMLTSLPYGGSIATIGNTHLSWMDIEFGGGGSNWLELQFFKEYVNGTTTLGNIWKNAITSYVETFPIDWDTPSGSTSSIDAKTVQQWVLIGDPTLILKPY
ncbi:MAG: C25 family cysteine peptidase [Candidatus Thermoplasmatota archaeon]|nr:C25 family cysteine peptidase [Candidatus Thermoplasmatota archaeon]